MKRKGCAGCGPAVTVLDDARYRVRLAVGRHDLHPTEANRRKAEQARDNLELAKARHREHMAEHEGETCESVT